MAELPSSHLHQTVAIQERIRRLLLSLPEVWAYGVFWRSTSVPSPTAPSSSASSSPGFILSWSDGWFRWELGAIQDSSHSLNPAETVISKIGHFYVVSSASSYPDTDSSCTLVRALKSGAFEWLSGVNEMCASRCERAQEASLYGVRTLICVPISDVYGVLELGSEQDVPQDPGLVLLIKAIFELSVEEMQPAVIPTPIADNAATVDETKNGNSPNNDCPDDDYQQLKQSTATPTPKKRGRKLSKIPALPEDHVMAERQRREKLNRNFCALRSAVPTITKLDKASLLADAVDYIQALRAKVDNLEAEMTKQDADIKNVPLLHKGAERPTASENKATARLEGVQLEIRLVGSDALIRVQSKNRKHPSAWLMNALRKLDMPVQHASVFAVGDQMVQDVVATAPAGLLEEKTLQNAIFAVLHDLTDE